MKHLLKEGDVLFGMWHYSMHYPVFFKVTKVTDKRAEAVQYFEKMMIPTDGGYGQQGYVVMDDNRPYDAKKKHIIRLGKRGFETGSYKNYDHYNLEPWDGQPVYADYCD